MNRILFALALPFVTVACDEQLDASVVDSGLGEEARAAAAAHGGSTPCGTSDVEVYENATKGEQCVHATFTNNCDSDMDIEPGTDGDEKYLDPGKTKTYSFPIPAGQSLTIDCDGSCQTEGCAGCTWELSFGGTCADLAEADAQVLLH